MTISQSQWQWQIETSIGKPPDPKSLVWKCENRTNVDVTMSTMRRNNALNDIEQNKLKWIEFLVAFIFKTSGYSYEVSLYRKLMLDSNQGQFLSQFNCGNHFSIRIDPTNAINETADSIDTKWPNCIFKVFWKSFWSVVISLVIWSMIIFIHFLKYGIILEYSLVLSLSFIRICCKQFFLPYTIWSTVSF